MGQPRHPTRPTRPLDIPVRHYPPGTERFAGPRYQAVQYVHRAVRRGEVSVVDGPVVTSDGMAHYVLRRHRAPTPAWVRPAAVGGVLLTALVALGWLVRLAVLAVEEAVRQAATPVALFFASGVLVLAVAWVRRRRAGRVRCVSGTFHVHVRTER